MYMTLKDFCLMSDMFNYLSETDFRNHLLSGHFSVNGIITKKENRPIYVGDIITLKYKQWGQKFIIKRIAGRPQTFMR